MKLFISRGLWMYYNHQIQLNKVSKKRSKIIIPNFQKDENGNEEVQKLEFTIPAKMTDLRSYSNFNTSISGIKKTLKGYSFTKQTKQTRDKVIYALLHYEKLVPSEIYIPSSMKKYVQVLEKIQFYDVVPDYGHHLVRIYLVKITVPHHMTIPFFFSGRKGLEYLNDHLIFYDTGYGEIETRTCNTHIYLNRSEREKYIPLSDL